MVDVKVLGRDYNIHMHTMLGCVLGVLNKKIILSTFLTRLPNCCAKVMVLSIGSKPVNSQSRLTFRLMNVIAKSCLDKVKKMQKCKNGCASKKANFDMKTFQNSPIWSHCKCSPK